MYRNEIAILIPVTTATSHEKSEIKLVQKCSREMSKIAKRPLNNPALSGNQYQFNARPFNQNRCCFSFSFDVQMTAEQISMSCATAAG